MEITILALNLTGPQPAPNGAEIGYPCEFRAEMGGGQALLVPRLPDPASLTGQQILVEVTQAEVSDFEPLPDATDRLPRLVPLEQPGSFRVTGSVRSITWLDDDPENALLEVWCGDCRFEFASSGLDLDEIEYGQWVRFQVQGLTLWNQRL